MINRRNLMAGAAAVAIPGVAAFAAATQPKQYGIPLKEHPMSIKANKIQIEIREKTKDVPSKEHVIIIEEVLARRVRDGTIAGFNVDAHWAESENNIKFTHVKLIFNEHQYVYFMLADIQNRS